MATKATHILIREDGDYSAFYTKQPKTERVLVSESQDPQTVPYI